MTRVTITSNLKIVSQTTRALNGRIIAVGKLKIKSFGDLVVNRMRASGKKITYPVKWDSAKQRRAYFATKGFGRGIPTKRTGKYIKGWKLVQIKDIGVRIENNTPGATYISGGQNGKRQSRIHAGRWRLLQSAIQTEIQKYPAEYQKTILISARGLKGVKVS